MGSIVWNGKLSTILLIVVGMIRVGVGFYIFDYLVTTYFVNTETLLFLTLSLTSDLEVRESQLPVPNDRSHRRNSNIPDHFQSASQAELQCRFSTLKSRRRSVGSNLLNPLTHRLQHPVGHSFFSLPSTLAPLPLSLPALPPHKSLNYITRIEPPKPSSVSTTARIKPSDSSSCRPSTSVTSGHLATSTSATARCPPAPFLTTFSLHMPIFRLRICRTMTASFVRPMTPTSPSIP